LIEKNGILSEAMCHRGEKIETQADGLEKIRKKGMQ